MHINFTVFEIRRGHEIVRAEREGYKREDVLPPSLKNNSGVVYFSGGHTANT